MKKPPEGPQLPASTAPVTPTLRPVLRLVKTPAVELPTAPAADPTEPAAPPAANQSKPPPKFVSPFGRFMSAYADAIDAQVAVIMSIETDK